MVEDNPGGIIKLWGRLDAGFRIHMGKQSLSGCMGLTLLGREHVGDPGCRQIQARHTPRALHLPIIPELVIEERLVEGSGVDGSKAAIHTVDAHLIRAQTNKGTEFAVCFMYGLHFATSVADP